LEWDNPASNFTLPKWEAIWSTMHENLGKTTLQIVWWCNKYHLKVPEFKPGDEVMLDRRIVQTKRPINKLDQKNMVPFIVTKDVGLRVYHLELPPQKRIYLVFHVSLLERYWSPSDLLRRVEPPEVEDIDGEVNWVVREVADSRVMCQKKIVEYVVLWEGYQQEDASWEPWEHFRNSAKKALISLHKRYPRKPRDG
jgi:hypothetical protein